MMAKGSFLPSCEIESMGYVCDREPNHGVIHFDADNGIFWITDPHTEEEWREAGVKSGTEYSGYRFITDTLLNPQKIATVR